MKRRIIQILGTIIPNSYLQVFWEKGNIYQGPLKGFCLPVLNCYACPSAYTSCPAGSLAHFAVIRAVPFFLIGFLGIAGIFLGRWTCGWICPFGFLQDLLFKLGRKLHLPDLKIPSVLKHFKYLVLVGLVIIVPIITMDPWFCKLCPAGALEGGIPQVILHPELRPLLGILFWSKIAILTVFIILMLLSQRIFCRMICPVGAILSFFNRISLLQLKVQKEHCILCQKCEEVCPMGVKIHLNPYDTNCIRCMECIKACPSGAIRISTYLARDTESSPQMNEA
ncbi:4Fe-4S binding protein [bacterium]|nr:4Fe-4S binding protein [bacterium]